MTRVFEKTGLCSNSTFPWNRVFLQLSESVERVRLRPQLEIVAVNEEHPGDRRMNWRAGQRTLNAIRRRVLEQI
jgi:hypothetical protein